MQNPFPQLTFSQLFFVVRQGDPLKSTKAENTRTYENHDLVSKEVNVISLLLVLDHNNHYSKMSNCDHSAVILDYDVSAMSSASARDV